MQRFILFSFLLLSFYAKIEAQGTNLKPGDIAIIGFQSDNNDQFAFLSLVDMSANTQIKFSEKGWNGSLDTAAFVTTTEGVHTWTAPSIGLAKGTAVTISFDNLGKNPVATFGTVQSSAAAKLSTAGDELIAYQGTASAPNFIYAFGSRAWINTGTPSSNQSWLPYPLVNGITARDFKTQSRDQYFKLATYSGTRDSILAAIGNTSNWTRSNIRFSSLPEWNFQILIHYYLNPIGDLIKLESWGSKPDGSGDAPVSFIETGMVFHLTNRIGTIKLSDNWSLDKLIIDKNISLSLNGFLLRINNMVDSSQGLIMGDSDARLTISGKSGPLNFDSNAAILNNLTLDTGASTSLTGTLQIVCSNSKGSVFLGDSTILNTNGYLVLTSSEKGSAILQTNGTAAILRGKVEVQKFIPSGKRNFRFLSHPFANPIPLSQLTVDIDITGKGGAANGFSPTNTNNPSAFWYDANAGDSGKPDLGWIAFTNTDGLANNVWQPKQGIRINIRGLKGEGLNGMAYLPSAVTLHLKDSLNIGDQKVILSKTTKNDGFNLIGNPFAADIDMSKLQIGQNISPNYYLWDPYLGMKGGYICYPFSSSVILPSFSAFFAQTNDSALGNQILFPETSKVATINPLRVLGVNENTKNQLEFIVESDSTNWDRALFIFKSNATDSLDPFDAKKMMNPDLSLFSWSSEKVKLCIDTRSSQHATLIPVGLIATINKKINLRVNQFPDLPGYDLFLIDRMNHNKILLKSGLTYSFQTDTIQQQKDSCRFEIQMIAKIANSIPITNQKLSCSIFPNPTTNQLFLKINAPKLLPITIKITNTTGQIFLIKKLEPEQQIVHTVYINNWAAGLYFLHISNTEEALVQKFIKN